MVLPLHRRHSEELAPNPPPKWPRLDYRDNHGILSVNIDDSGRPGSNFELQSPSRSKHRTRSSYDMPGVDIRVEKVRATFCNKILDMSKKCLVPGSNLFIHVTCRWLYPYRNDKAVQPCVDFFCCQRIRDITRFIVQTRGYYLFFSLMSVLPVYIYQLLQFSQNID